MYVVCVHGNQGWYVLWGSLCTQCNSCAGKVCAPVYTEYQIHVNTVYSLKSHVCTVMVLAWLPPAAVSFSYENVFSLDTLTSYSSSKYLLV